MRRKVKYDDVTRCHECAENFPLVLAFLGQCNITTSFIKSYYECGQCGTELTVDWADNAVVQLVDEPDEDE